jgi:hypothetical protein
MLSMRHVARAAFRFAAAAEPPQPDAARPTSGLLDPRHLARAGMLAARFGAELLETLWRGSHAGLGYLELDNKLRAFHFFETVVAALELERGPLVPGEAIRSAQRRLGHEQAVWATEGIGYELFERRRNARASARGLLSAAADGVPSGSWTVLHTGMGMALAEAGLERIAAAPSAPLRRRAVEDHVAECREAARPGYAELAFEPLGLVARILHPELVAGVAAELAALGGPWAELFWHGVGRGLYFLPANLPPARSAPWMGLAGCREEPVDERGRNNAVGGFSWAVALVNLRRPAVVEAFLAQHAASGDPRDPVAQGVASALELWQEASGGSKELRAFVGHLAAPDRRALWQRLVREPFEQTQGRLANTGPERASRLPDLFRYR